jgi:hypothetical protein
MGNLQNFRKHKQINYATGIGEKVKNLVEFGVGLKNAYDIGRTVYSLAQTASPYVLPLLGAL